MKGVLNMNQKNCNKILEKIAEMQCPDIETIALRVEFIERYQAYAHQFLPEDYLKFENLFLTYHCTSNYAMMNRVLDTDDLFKIAIDVFKNKCQEIIENEGMSGLEMREKEVGEADRMFIFLVKAFNAFAKYSDNEGEEMAVWPAKKTALNVLNFMQEYYWQSV